MDVTVRRAPPAPHLRSGSRLCVASSMTAYGKSRLKPPRRRRAIRGREPRGALLPIPSDMLCLRRPSWSVATAPLARRRRRVPCPRRRCRPRRGSRPSPPAIRAAAFIRGFRRGPEIHHRLTRTVTQMDNMLFSNMTLNPQPLHIDAHFCATETEWGRPHRQFAVHARADDRHLGQRHDGRTTIANLGMTDVRFPAPVFEGDPALRDHHPVEARSRSAPDRRPRRDASPRLQADGTLVAECKRQAFMLKRPA